MEQHSIGLQNDIAENRVRIASEYHEITDVQLIVVLEERQAIDT